MSDSSLVQLELSAENLEMLLQRYKNEEDVAVELALYLVRMAINGFECIVVTRDTNEKRPELCCAEDEHGDLYLMAFTSEEKNKSCDYLYPIRTTIRELIRYVVEDNSLNGVFVNWKTNESVILDRRFLLVLQMAIEHQGEESNMKKNN